jgi:hypothetical protein
MKQAKFTVTKTILNKSIQDCNSAMRDLLKESGVVDYDSMAAGDRVELTGFFSDGTETKISAYRAKKRGDKRIWFSSLKNYASAGDVMALVVDNGRLVIKNLTKASVVFVFTSGFFEGSISWIG